MSRNEKIQRSEYLTDEAKEIYKEERERFLQNKIDEQDETINNALKSIDVNFKFVI